MNDDRAQGTTDNRHDHETTHQSARNGRRSLLTALGKGGLAFTAFAAMPKAALATASIVSGSHTSQTMADMVHVHKAKRELQLWRGGDIIRSYRVALGKDPKGHKEQQGDNRTPEGAYKLDWRNPESNFHLSINISYPNEQDRRNAAERGVDPGRHIMIHGLPNGFTAYQIGHPEEDWTNGCIAVTNDEMREIWEMVPDGTTILIFA